MANRFDYVAYDALATKFQADAKAKCQAVENFLDQAPESRAKALAMTHLEIVYMWIGKMIRDDQIIRNGKAELQESRKSDAV